MVDERPGLTAQQQGPWRFPIFSFGGAYTAGPDDRGDFVLWSNSDQRAVYTAPEGWHIRGISNDASLVVLVTSELTETGSVETRLVRTVDGSEVARLDVGGREMPEAVFTPDDAVVLTSNNSTSAVFRLWDATTGAFLREIEPALRDVGGSVEPVEIGGFGYRFTPDGTRLVVGGYDGTIWVLDTEGLLSGRPAAETIVRQIDAHNQLISRIRVSRNGGWLLSHANDEQGKVWDLDTGQALGEFGSTNLMIGDFHPIEPLLYVPLPGDQIGVYTLDPDELMEIARSRLTRDMTVEECQAYLSLDRCPSNP
jgi:WD40 repeat protein